VNFARRLSTALSAAVLLGIAAFAATPAPAAAPVSGATGGPITCNRAEGLLAPDSATYYSIDLVPTRRIPGTAFVDGRADVTFALSPFVVTVSPDGSYNYDVHVTLDGLRAPREGGYVAWVTTTEIDEIRRLGPLEDGRISGPVDWNKFLVVVTLEPDPTSPTDRWTGPVAFRGMSRSGNMHTMAGHGPFQDEKCAAYGYE